MNFASTMKLAAGKTGLWIKAKSPEILLATGIAATLAGVYLACKETLKVDEVIKEAEEKKKQIAEFPASEEYTEEDRAHDGKIVAVQTGVKIAKTYAPAAGVLLLAITCYCASYGIIKSRNVALTAAYNTMKTAYDAYRKRVATEVGEEREQLLYRGAEKTKIDTIVEDENGKKKKVKEEVYTSELEGLSPYARIFDEFNCPTTWSKSPIYNRNFIESAQRYANDMLWQRGHLFLNEVYDLLGMDRSKEGQIVGWKKKDSEGDGYIDFGLMELRGKDFMEGHNPSIMLDFNVDGPILETF